MRNPDWRPAAERETFASSILLRYLRRTRALEELLPWLYLKGVSTGDFSEALAALLGPEAPGLSATTMARLKSCWEDEYKAWKGGGPARPPRPRISSTDGEDRAFLSRLHGARDSGSGRGSRSQGFPAAATPRHPQPSANLLKRRLDRGICRKEAQPAGDRALRAIGVSIGDVLPWCIILVLNGGAHEPHDRDSR
jgi:hypothetical protein